MRLRRASAGLPLISAGPVPPDHPGRSRREPDQSRRGELRGEEREASPRSIPWADPGPVAGRGACGRCARQQAPSGSLAEPIDLPDGFQPEGITSGLSSRFGGSTKLFVGSRANGAIWKGSAKTGTGSILVPAGSQAALGLHVDWRGRLWVAGGASQTIRVYNSKTGALLRSYSFPTTGFLNDLVITRSGVYATDSVNQQLAVVPFRHWSKHSRHKWGRLPATSKAKTLALTGEIAYTTGFNANGIVPRAAGWCSCSRTPGSSSASTRGRASPRRSIPTATASRMATASSCVAAGCTWCATRTTSSRCLSSASG